MRYAIAAAGIPAWLVSTMMALSQDASAPSDPASSSIFVPPEPGFAQTVVDAVVAQSGTIGAAIAGVVIAGLLAFLRKLQIELDKFRKSSTDPVHGKLPEFDQYAVNAMVVGIGGTGKTSVIRSLSACEEADPEIKTDVNRTYSMVNEVSITSKAGEHYRRRTRIYIDDHVGQQMQSIFDTDMAKKRGLDRVKRCLIIVVDLFDIVDSDDRPLSKSSFDKKRIEKNLAQYSDAFLQVLTSFLNDGDKFVVFINKIDQLVDITEEAVDKAKQAYRPLTEKLKAISGKKTMVVVGSAARGLGLVSSDASGAPHSLLSILVRSASRLP